MPTEMVLALTLELNSPVLTPSGMELEPEPLELSTPEGSEQFPDLVPEPFNFYNTKFI